jgi:hypothetical protein
VLCVRASLTVVYLLYRKDQLARGETAAAIAAFSTKKASTDRGGSVQLMALPGSAPSTYDGGDAFAEPDDTWLPTGTQANAHTSESHRAAEGTNTFGIAPRRFHRPTKKSMAHKMPKPFLDAQGNPIKSTMSGILDHVETAEEEEEELAEEQEEEDELETKDLDTLSFNLSHMGKPHKPKRKQSVKSPGRKFSVASTGSGAGASVGTVQLEHVAEQLLSSDELMRILAKRLGLDANLIIPAEDMSVMSGGAGGGVNAGLLSVGSSQSGSGVGLTPNAPRGKQTSLSSDLNAIDENDDEFNEEGDDFDSDEDLWSDDEEIEVGDVDADEADHHQLPKNYGEMAQLKRYVDVWIAIYCLV